MMNAHYRLKTSSLLLIGALVLTSCASGRSAFKRGKEAELNRDFDVAVTNFQLALKENPGNYEYRLKYEQSRYAAAFMHFEAGRRAFEKDDLQLAKSEFTRAVDLDPTHNLAQME